MSELLFKPPPIRDLPLTKGQDLIVNFKNRIPNVTPAQYQPYESGVSVLLVIETSPATEVLATIDGENAVCKVESTETDTIRDGTLWRAVVNFPDNINLVAINGATVRWDGVSNDDF